eukprot:21017_5
MCLMCLVVLLCLVVRLMRGSAGSVCVCEWIQSAGVGSRCVARCCPRWCLGECIFHPARDVQLDMNLWLMRRRCEEESVFVCLLRVARLQSGGLRGFVAAGSVVALQIHWSSDCPWHIPDTRYFVSFCPLVLHRRIRSLPRTAQGLESGQTVSCRFLV